MTTKNSDLRRRIDLRISPELAELLDEEATHEHRTLNAHIAYLLERHVDAWTDRRAVVRKEARGIAVRQDTAAALRRTGASDA